MKLLNLKPLSRWALMSLMMGALVLSTTSCSDDDAGDVIEDAGDEIEDATDEVEDAVDDIVDDN